MHIELGLSRANVRNAWAWCPVIGVARPSIMTKVYLEFKILDTLKIVPKVRTVCRDGVQMYFQNPKFYDYATTLRHRANLSSVSARDQAKKRTSGKFQTEPHRCPRKLPDVKYLQGD